MTRTLAASETIGVRAMLVHAIDENARKFYLHHGLEPSRTDPLHLMILIKDIAAAINAAKPRSVVGSRPPLAARAHEGA